MHNTRIVNSWMVWLTVLLPCVATAQPLPVVRSVLTTNLPAFGSAGQGLFRTTGAPFVNWSNVLESIGITNAVSGMILNSNTIVLGAVTNATNTLWAWVPIKIGESNMIVLTAVTNATNTLWSWVNVSLDSKSNFIVSAHGTVEITNNARASNIWDRSNVKWWGATGDGVTDDTTALTNAAANASGKLYFPPGDYKLTLPLNFFTNYYGLQIRGDKATILWLGEGYAIHFRLCVAPLVEGLTIDYSSSVSATNGAVLLEQTIHATLRDLMIVPAAASTGPSVVIQSFVPDDGSTGSYWNTLDNVRFKPSAWSTFTGVLMSGAANATTIHNCTFSDFALGILGNQYGTNLIVNSVTIDDCKFEGGHRCVVIDGGETNVALGSGGTGFRLVNCRLEKIFDFLAVTNRGTVPFDFPPFLQGNEFGDATNYVSGTTNYISLDYAVPSGFTIHGGTNIVIQGGVIQLDGKVGVGTNKPQAAFHVAQIPGAEGVAIGGWAADPTYSAIGLKGTLGANTYNFMAAPGAGQTFYINRGQYGSILFVENHNLWTQMIMQDQSSGGGIGIWTNTPQAGAALHVGGGGSAIVDGSVTVNSNMLVGGNQTNTGALQITTTKSGETVFIQKAQVGNTSGNTVHAYTVIQPGSASSSSWTGIASEAYYNSGLYYDSSAIKGIRGEGVAYNTGKANQVMGVQGAATYNGNDTTNLVGQMSLYAGFFSSAVTGVGMADHMIGVKLERPSNSGLVGQAFGLYVANQTPSGAGVLLSGSSAVHIEGAGSSNAITFSGGNGSSLYSKIYSDSANVLSIDATAGLLLNASGGNVGIGTNSPAAALHVGNGGSAVVDGTASIGKGAYVNFGGGLNPVGAYGSLMMNATNIIVCAGAASVYTNVAGTGFTTIVTNGFFGNTAAIAAGLTNLYAGWYRVTICASALGANNQATEWEIFTNGVACDLIGMKKTFDAAARLDDLSMTGIVYLPANCGTQFKVQDAGTGAAISIHRASMTIGTP